MYNRSPSHIWLRLAVNGQPRQLDHVFKAMSSTKTPADALNDEMFSVMADECTPRACFKCCSNSRFDL